MVACNNSLIELGDAAVKTEKPLFGHVTFHHVGLAVTAVFALISTIISLALMYLHATHYSVPYQQKHIIRILFMIPVYACISLVSYIYYTHAVYWEVLRDCYEAFALASFFVLMCAYLEKDLHEQKERFRALGAGRGLRNWIWPVPWMQKCTGGEFKGPLRTPRSGLTWFNVIYVGVFQYCFIRVLFTFVAMFTQLFKRYCESSLSPAFGHVWVMGFETVSITFAMYFLIQFYFQLRGDLAEYKPFLKILCIKLVIFFSFWQSIIISFLSSSFLPGGALLHATEKVSYADIQVGIPSMLLAIEMSFFAVAHIFAFPWKPYDIAKNPDPGAQYYGGPLGVKALWDAFNLWDVVKAAARGFRWLFHGARHRETDISYEASRANSIGGTSKYTPDEDTSYGRPPKYTSADEAQELNMLRTDARGRPAPPMRTLSNESDDHAGLLSHAQSNPVASSVSPPKQAVGISAPTAGGVDVPSISVRGPSPYRSTPAGSRDPSTTGYGTPASERRDPFNDHDVDDHFEDPFDDRMGRRL